LISHERYADHVGKITYYWNPVMTKPLLTVILPTYNESGNIGKIVAQIFKNIDDLGDQLEILFIDDSTDESPDLIRAGRK